MSAGQSRLRAISLLRSVPDWLYAYRVAALAEFSSLPPAPLETCEALEQLRALTHGYRIKVGVIDVPPPRGVDTADDLRAVAALLAQRDARI